MPISFLLSIIVVSVFMAFLRGTSGLDIKSFQQIVNFILAIKLLSVTEANARSVRPHRFLRHQLTIRLITMDYFRQRGTVICSY